jgi:hypothetical protein
VRERAALGCGPSVAPGGKLHAFSHSQLPPQPWTIDNQLLTWLQQSSEPVK